jgi:hypothetical protein
MWFILLDGRVLAALSVFTGHFSENLTWILWEIYPKEGPALAYCKSFFGVLVGCYLY